MNIHSTLSKLIITPRAIQKLKSINSPLRVSVESGGCNGFQYKMEISNSMDDQDVIFDKEGTRVIVDKISLDYIKGSTLDFSEELIGSSPLIQYLLPILSKIGIILFIGWVSIGWLNFYSQGTIKSVQRFGLWSFKSTRVKQESLIDIQAFLDSNLPIERLQKCILNLLDNILIKGFQKTSEILERELKVPTCHLPLIKQISFKVSQWFVDAKEDHLEQLIWIKCWSEICKFIKTFKKIRRDVLRDNYSSLEARKKAEGWKEDGMGFVGTDTTPHLDDYNFLNEDENTPWDCLPLGVDGNLPSENLDELMIQISERFIAQGLLHPAVGNAEQEKSYIRLIMDQLFIHLGWKDSPGNKLSKLIFREFVGCYGIWSWIDKLSQPEILNGFILERASKRYIAQASVKTFRAQLQNHYTQFPPTFLSMPNHQTVVSSLASKFRYFDGISKYAKKSNCLIDLKAVYHQIIMEIRARLQDARELPNKKSDIFEAHRRYLKALDLIKSKYEKRISFLVLEDEKKAINKRKSLCRRYRPLLSLRSLLDEYMLIDEEKGGEASPSLFYFLDFLEQESGTMLIKYWIVASKLKKLYSQCNPMVMDFSENLQKEVQKIYKMFSVDPFYGLEETLNAIEVYGLTKMPEDLYSACLAIFKTQFFVFEELEQIYNRFLDSDIYFKLIVELLYADDTIQSSDFNLKSEDGKSIIGNSIILSQLEMILQRESLRLTGGNSTKYKEAWEASDTMLFSGIEDVLDVDALENDLLLAERMDEGIFSNYEFLSDDSLQNSTKLQQIKEDLDRNEQQLDVLNILWQKCQISDRLPAPAQIMQLHIIEQSQALIRREINVLIQEKIKYQTKEQREAIMPGSCIVRINCTTEAFKDRKKVAFYDIIVDKESGSRRWSVRKRYNDFHSLHRKLKEKFPIVHEFDLPGKTISIFHSKNEKEDLKKERMMALEKYLQRLLDNPLICQSDELKRFLSSSEYKGRKYRTINSVIGNSNSSGFYFKSITKKNSKTFSTMDSNFENEQKDEYKRYSAIKPSPSSTESSSDDIDDGQGDWGISGEDQTDDDSNSLGDLSDPLCRVVMEIFDFKERDDVKKTAAAMLLKQYFGGRISLESELSDMLCNYMTEDVLCKILSRTNFDSLFGIAIGTTSKCKSSSQENVSRNEIRTKLISVWPEVFSRFLGTDAAQNGVGRILDVMQSSILNRHVIFTLLDSVLESIFEEE